MRNTGTMDGTGAASERSDAEAVVEALAELHQLDANGLRRRWRSLVGGPLPQDLGRPLALRVLAYALQAQRLGDLDKASRRELAAVQNRPKEKDQIGEEASSRSMRGVQSVADKAGSEGPAPRIARSGTVLTREHGGIMHRVIVLDAGVSWNGKTYESLSQVAFAITGTRWNGPRFFGLRADKKGQAARLKPEARLPAAIAGREGSVRLTGSPQHRAGS